MPFGMKKEKEDKRIRLSLMQEETLKEIGNLGAAKATDVLSKMTKIRVNLIVPYIQILPVEQIPNAIIAPREIIASTFMRLFGDYPGGVLVLYRKQTALILVDLMLGRTMGTTKRLAEEDISAFIEMSNILNNTYLTALANFFNAKFEPGTPKVVLDIDYLLNEFTKEAPEEIRYALIIGTRFTIEKEKKVEGEFILLLDTSTLEKLLKILNERLKKKKDMIF